MFSQEYLLAVRGGQEQCLTNAPFLMEEFVSFRTPPVHRDPKKAVVPTDCPLTAPPDQLNSLAVLLASDPQPSP